MNDPTVSPLPDVLKLLANDTRWHILSLLAQSDYRVHELAESLAAAPNQVSYHLGLLRDAGLIAERRSSKDGRDIYYSLNLNSLRERYFEAGELLHPAFAIQPDALPKIDWDDVLDEMVNGAGEGAAGDLPPTRVLFVCTHNSARSQMAEALLKHLGGEDVEAYSAGTISTEVNPYAIRVMDEYGIDIRDQHSKHLDEFDGQTFDYVLTVCDSAREECPVFPGVPHQIHWSFPDPSVVPEAEGQRLAAFRTTARQLNQRIHHLLLIIRRNRLQGAH
jgi:protein-tyrosine-phosphatase/DNA-binding transcriptional ArsR family regulator